MKPPVQSTYCSNPAATHVVEGAGPDGGGVFGYFTDEFSAHRVAKFYRARGNIANVEKYDPLTPVAPGVNKFVNLMIGFV